MLYGKKGFVDGVYIVQVSGYEKIRYFFIMQEKQKRNIEKIIT